MDADRLNSGENSRCDHVPAYEALQFTPTVGKTLHG